MRAEIKRVKERGQGKGHRVAVWQQVLHKRCCWQTMPQGIGAISAQLIDLRHFLSASPTMDAAEIEREMKTRRRGEGCGGKLRFPHATRRSASSPCLQLAGICGMRHVAFVAQLQRALSLATALSLCFSLFLDLSLSLFLAGN